MLRFAFSLKDSYYAYLPPHLNKTLPTLRNEKKKQKITFYKKLLDELIFLRVTKNLKMF